MMSMRIAAALSFAAVSAGCAVLPFHITRHHAAVDAGTQDVAAARRALRQRRWPVAIARAEHAVSLDGTDGERRALLGTAYLRAGRFASAAQAFADTLALRQPDAATVLHLTLAQIASGRHDAALATLAVHSALLPAADHGLALALAGQPVAGVEVLMAAMRVPGADARTRQNLALALALAGEWPDAYFLVGLDLQPAQARQRILDWMRFARPAGPADQVAALLKVTPAPADPGLPVALALHHTAPPTTQASAATADDAAVTAMLAGTTSSRLPPPAR